MAGELIVEVKIGGAIDPALGKVFSQIESQIGTLESYASRIGQALKWATQEALPLATAVKEANDTALRSAQPLLGVLEDIRRKLSEHMGLLPGLIKEYGRLGRSMGGAQLPGAGHQASQQTSPPPGAIVLEASKTVFDSTKSTVEKFATYESIVSDLVIKGEKDPDKRGSQTKEVNKLVAQISAETSLGKTEAAGLLWNMLNEGMNLSSTLQQGVLAARFSESQGVDAATVAALFRTLLSNGVTSDQLPGLLNKLVHQAGKGSFGVADSAKAIIRIMPQSEKGGVEAATRIAAILQMKAEPTGNFYEVLSGTQESFLEYRREGKSEPTGDRFGQMYMPPKDAVPNHISIDLEARSNTLATKAKEQQTSEERLVLAMGAALKPIVSMWMTVVTDATNVLSAAVEEMKSAVTILAGVVLGGAGLVKLLGLAAQGLMVWGAGKALAASTGAEGALSRFVPFFSSVLPLVLAGGKAVDTYQNATTFKEKSQGYGEAAGMAIGGVVVAVAAKRLGPLGPFVSALVSVGVANAFGYAGKLIGGWVGDVFGEDTERMDGSDRQSHASSAIVTPLAARPGTLTTPPETELPALRQLMGIDGSSSGPVWQSPSPTVRAPGDSADISNGFLGQSMSNQRYLPAPVAASETGDVVRFMFPDSPSATVLPASESSLQSLARVAPAQQNFTVSASIPVNVQGNIGDPAEFARMLQPEIQRMFTNIAARTSTGGHLYDDAAFTA